MNANYKHGMCVNGHSKEYKKIHNKKSYIKNREARLEKQNAYGAEHREHKRWYDKHRYWQQKLAAADSQEQKEKCLKQIHYLEENAV